jgi:hypothetical protein
MHLRQYLRHAFTPIFTPCIYAIFYAMHLRHTDGWEVLCTEANTAQAKKKELTPQQWATDNEMAFIVEGKNFLKKYLVPGTPNFTPYIYAILYAMHLRQYLRHAFTPNRWMGSVVHKRK